MAPPSSESSPSADGASVPDAESLLSRAGIGVFRLASTGEFVAVNDALAALTGRSPDALVGRSLTRILSTVPSSLGPFLSNGERGPVRAGSLTLAVPLETASDGVVPCEMHLRPLPATEDGTESRVVGTVHRRSDRRTAARSRRERPPIENSASANAFVALADAVTDGIIVLDTDSEIQYANPAVERILGHAPDELVGGGTLSIVPERLRDAHLDALQRYLDTGERNIRWEYAELPGRHKDGHEVPLGISLNDFFFDGDRYVVGLFRDISPRKEAEWALAARVAQQEVVSELGYRALETADVDGFLDEVVERVAAVLDAEFCTVFELDDAAEEAALRAGVGWEDGHVRSATVSATESASQVGRTLAAGESVVVEAFATDARVDGPDFLTDRGVRSGVSAVIGPLDDPWGVLGVHETSPREFATRDVHFVENVANVVATAVSRHERVRRLETQRMQLDALNQLNRLVHEIQRAVVKQSSREEIERLVCDRIVERDTYTLAWIGRVDLRAETVVPAARAGGDDGCPAATEADGDAVPLGPGAEAIRTREPNVVPAIATDDALAPWRDTAFDCEYRSMAAIPIVHEETVFGVLFVYADEVAAFGPDVQRVLGSFGATLGHAIAAANRKRALLGRRVTVAQLRLEGYVGRVAPDTANVGRIEINRAIPTGDGSYLAYGEAPTDAEVGLRTLVEETEKFEGLSVAETDDGVRFEIRVTESALLSRVIGYGGRVTKAVLDDADLVATIELPPTVELATVADAIGSDAPNTGVLLNQRRTTTRTIDEPDALPDDLTDRQRTALETAYFGGFFEWPRERNGEELAEKLGIASPTFQEHLRAGLRKTVAKAFGDRRSSR